MPSQMNTVTWCLEIGSLLVMQRLFFVAPRCNEEHESSLQNVPAANQKRFIPDRHQKDTIITTVMEHLISETPHAKVEIFAA